MTTHRIDTLTLLWLLGASGSACEQAAAASAPWEQPNLDPMLALAPAGGDVVARVTAEPGATQIIAADGTLPEGTLTGKLVEGGVTYLIVENSKDDYMPNVRHAPLGQLVADHGAGLEGHGRSLLFYGYGSPTDYTFTEKPEWSNDRLELVLSRGDTDAIAFGKTTYFRFYTRLAADFETPQDELIISQVWQISSSAARVGPVFAIYLVGHPDPKKMTMSFRYRDDRNDPQDADHAHTFHDEVIEKGKWYNFHLMMIPRHVEMPGGRGAILIWKNRGLNGTLVDSAAINYDRHDDTKYKFYWGFPPEPGWANDPNKLGNRFDIRVGIYRAMPSKHAPIWFDSLKVTRTAAAMKGL